MVYAPAVPTLRPRKVVRENPCRAGLLASGYEPNLRAFPGASAPGGLFADFVAGYSCGAAMDSHHLPFSPILGARRELPIYLSF